MNWHRVRRYAGFALVCFILVAVLFAEWSVSAGASGWMRIVAIEIRAACWDSGTQWMVMVCLVSYFVTFLFLERRILPQQNTENSEDSKGQPPSPPSVFRSSTSIAAFLTFFRGNVSKPNFWLVGLVGMVLLRYAFAYETAARSLQPLVLLAGIVFGKGVALWARSLKSKVQGLKLEGDASSGWATFSPSEAEKGIEAERGAAPSSINHQLSTFNRTQAIFSTLVFLLAASALWQPEYGMDFQYRGQRRWTGAWDNPNLYGLLMGVGAILAVGLFVQSLKSKVQSPGNAERGMRSAERWRWVKFALLLPAAGLCALGLVKSYSRGAWLGTACGLSYLVWFVTKIRVSEQFILGELNCGGLGKPISWYTRNWRPLCVLLASVLVLSFWQFRHTENLLARRVFSIGNPNDFSWRNRISTWAGAVTMMKDRPWVGHGWGTAEAVLGEKYKPVRLEDAAAIQMNDYLMLGISSGVPALLCLLIYLWLVSRSVCREPTESSSSPVTCHPSLPTICLAGAIVGMMGFWFDGGLFKLPMAAVFWVLMELARGSSRGHETQTSCALVRPVGDSSRRLLPVNKGQIGLRWLAGILAALAIAQTVLHLGTPRLAVSERTIAIARKFLVPPKAKQDFEFLAAEPIWSANQLGTLLEHVELANYNRHLVNWKLADDVYGRFVLSPQIDAALDREMNWRRPLWESFYPRIRKESSLEAAAEIIVRLLRDRVRVVEPSGSPETIVEIWQRGSASERGFEVISVAALRSAGVPARLAERGRAEFWNGGEWQPFH